MEPDIQYGLWYAIETTNGTEFIPADLADLGLEADTILSKDDEGFVDAAASIRDYVTGDPLEITLRTGYGARLSMPGYMDCTEWSVFDTEDEAAAWLTEMYGDEEPFGPDEGDLTSNDHVHWFQHGKCVLTTGDDYKGELRAFMDREKHWPNAWFVSDHGNAHLIEL